MEQNNINSLQPAEIKAVRDLEKLFGDAGWAIVQEHLTGRIEQVKANMVAVTTWEQHVRLSGMLQVYQELEGFEQLALGHYEALAEERKEAQEAEDRNAAVGDFT